MMRQQSLLKEVLCLIPSILRLSEIWGITNVLVQTQIPFYVPVRTYIFVFHYLEKWRQTLSTFWRQFIENMMSFA